MDGLAGVERTDHLGHCATDAGLPDDVAEEMILVADRTYVVRAGAGQTLATAHVPLGRARHQTQRVIARQADLSNALTERQAQRAVLEEARPDRVVLAGVELGELGVDGSAGRSAPRTACIAPAFSVEMVFEARVSSSLRMPGAARENEVEARLAKAIAQARWP